MKWKERERLIENDFFFFYNQKAEVKHEETILCITEIGVTMWKAARLSITALKC